MISCKNNDDIERTIEHWGAHEASEKLGFVSQNKHLDFKDDAVIEFI